LYVLRHAKSSWSDPLLDDLDRPLSARGVRSVALLSRHLKAAGVVPDLVLCSPARRAVETVDGLRPALREAATVWFDHAVYDADADDLLALVRTVPREVRRLLLVGHNPAVQELVLDLSRDHLDERRAAVQAKFPTGALATLRFEGGWSALAPGTARLTDLVTPRSLSG
jgi:phosphohistidine phosphatase